MLTEFYQTYQHFIMGICLCGISIILLAPFFRFIADFIDKVWKGFLHLDGFGGVAVSLFVIGLFYYGSTKESGWTRVRNDGADSGIGLVGVYTTISNDIQVVSGQTVTNEIPLVKVSWTNGSVTASTPVSVRMSDTNNWEALVKQSPSTSTEGTTNNLIFVTQRNKIGFLYWWVGVDLPPVIHVSSGIEITRVVELHDRIRIEFSCDDARAVDFEVYNKRTDASTWTFIGETSNKYFECMGFFLDKEMDWKITSTFLEDGE